jgi:hypothetical protein
VGCAFEPDLVEVAPGAVGIAQLTATPTPEHSERATTIEVEALPSYGPSLERQLQVLVPALAPVLPPPVAVAAPLDDPPSARASTAQPASPPAADVANGADVTDAPDETAPPVPPVHAAEPLQSSEPVVVGGVLMADAPGAALTAGPTAGPATARARPQDGTRISKGYVAAWVAGIVGWAAAAIGTYKLVEDHLDGSAQLAAILGGAALGAGILTAIVLRVRRYHGAGGTAVRLTILLGVVTELPLPTGARWGVGAAAVLLGPILARALALRRHRRRHQHVPEAEPALS